MIKAYNNADGLLYGTPMSSVNLAEPVWLDLVEPTPEEERVVETALGVEVPTREEMEEIEVSSRLYHEGSTAFMTVLLPSNTDGDEPILAPVTFVLTDRQLLTIRYHEPRAFSMLPMRAAKSPVAGEDGASVLVVLLELQIDRLADVLERAGRETHGLSRQVWIISSGGTAAPLTISVAT